MSAIITNNFRRNSCEVFLDDVQNSNQYYIGLGKSDPWPYDYINDIDEDASTYSVPLPNSTIVEDQDVLDNLLALVKVSRSDTLIPRNGWKSGRKYKVYDTGDPLLFEFENDEYPCFTTINNNVYVCLDNNGGQESTSQPVSSYDQFQDTTHVYVAPDGYVWAFVQNNDIDSPFYTAEFIPINEDITDTATQILARDATGGLIYNFITVGGNDILQGNETIILSGVDVNGANIPDIDLTNDLRFETSFSSGSVTVEYTNKDIPNNALLAYKKASITVYNSSNEVLDFLIRPLVAPTDGFGSRPKSEFPSFYAGCQAAFEGNVDGEALVDSLFRQISLIKNPGRDDSGPSSGDDGSQYADEEALDALDYIVYEESVSILDLPVGSIITQSSTGARAYLDQIDTLENRIYFHKNSDVQVNYNIFSDDGEIVVTSPDGVQTMTLASNEINSIINSEYTHDTGEVYFVDHRKKITRNLDQTENVKIVIQF